MNPTHLKKLIPFISAFIMLIFLGSATFADVKEAPTRDQIEDQYKWDLTDFFPSDEAWEEELVAFTEQIPKIEEYKGNLGNSAETLAACLMLSDSLGGRAHRLYVYAALKLDEDNRVGKYQEMRDRIYMQYSRLSQASSYIEPEILTIPEETLKSYLENNSDLNTYEFYLEDMLRRKAHILSESEEKLLALASPVARAPGKIFTMMDDADIKFPNVFDEEGNEIELTRGRLSLLMESTDRKVRKEAYDAYNDTYLDYQNALGATLASSVDADLFYTRARGYNTALEKSLDANQIPTDVFHNLIETVSNNLEPLHRYTRIRKQALGYDTLFPYDMQVPLVPESKMEFTYEEAKKLVLEALKPLGDEYLESLKMGLESRWVDVYETSGKGSGAYSWGTYSVHPVVLLNFSGTLDNVFTLAHEMGHAMHSHYTYQNEPYAYAGHSLFCAEVASTCNESILIKYMIEKAKDKNEKLYLLNYYINQILGTFYTQVMFSEFELKIHDLVENGGALSAESMRKMYREIYEKYYGPDYFLPENRDLGCLRIGHFYRAYYVYQYATSYAASQMLSQMILNRTEGAQQAYLDFISTGSSEYPIEILKKAGIDMTKPEAVENTIQIFAELVDEYERLLLTN